MRWLYIMNNTMNIFTLKFRDKNLEKEFVVNENTENIFQIRFGLLLSISVFFIYGLVDTFTYPQSYQSLWLIRLAIILLLSILFVVSFHPKYVERLQLYHSVSLVLIFAGLIRIYAYDIETIYVYIFFASYALLISGAFTVVGITFFNAFIVISLVNIALTILIFVKFDYVSAFLYTILFFSMTILQSYGSYFAERAKRNLFINNKELQEKQAIMFQQSKLASMGEMVGNIAHQWRQPLNALSLVIQNIDIYYESGMLDKTTIDRTVEKGERLINSMSSTIDDFRDFYKPNKEKELFFIEKAIEKAYTIIKSNLINNGIDYKIDIEDPSLQINGFSNEFSQVIINLFSNARDVLIERKTIDATIMVHVYTKKDTIYVDVSDNGGGINDDKIDRIFEPYFTTKEEGKGTGIGLYMSKNIIESHMEGTLSAHNNDTGACLRIELSKNTI